MANFCFEGVIDDQDKIFFLLRKRERGALARRFLRNQLQQ